MATGRDLRLDPDQAQSEILRKPQRGRRPQPNGPIVRMNVLEK